MKAMTMTSYDVFNRGRICIIVIGIIILVEIFSSYILQYEKQNPRQELATPPSKLTVLSREELKVNLPEDHPQDYWFDHWQQVSHDIYVYSAFWDNRSVPLVRILAKVDSSYELNSFQCLFDFGNITRVSVSRPHAYHKFPKNCNDEGSVELHCVPKVFIKPIYVAIWSGFARQPLKWMKVRAMSTKLDIRNRTVLCVPILTEGFNKLFNLAEYIAYYSTIGIKYFVFYDGGMSEMVRNFLFSLKNEAFSVELLPFVSIWKRSLKSNLRENQALAIQDCMYRKMGLYEYAGYIRINELLAIKRHFKLQDLLASQKSRLGPRCCEKVVFRTATPCINDAFPSKTRNVALTTMLSSPTMLSSDVVTNSSRYFTLLSTLNYVLCGERTISQFRKDKTYFVPVSLATVYQFEQVSNNMTKKVCVKEAGNRLKDANPNISVINPKISENVNRLLEKWNIRF
ncbi:uncharacterized protein LOC143253608 [Tachypleus tridentatus]|uniref:uncharacterized protein LOC143253608 n=1 Tax=Tachypleus tridentatus TaxID=6853 RepID=UPI003FD11E7C